MAVPLEVVAVEPAPEEQEAEGGINSPFFLKIFQPFTHYNPFVKPH